MLDRRSCRNDKRVARSEESGLAKLNGEACSVHEGKTKEVSKRSECLASIGYSLMFIHLSLLTMSKT